MDFFSKTVEIHLWVYILGIVCMALNIFTNIYSIIRSNRKNRGD